MTASPYTPLTSGRDLPAAFRDQLLLSPEDDYFLEIRGTMARIWHHPAALRPLLWLTAQARALFPEQGANVPTLVTVTAHRDKDGQPYHHWRRQFQFSGVARCFESFHSYDPDAQCIVEAQGPGRMFEARYRLRFINGGHFEFDLLYGVLRLGGLHVRLPRWAWVTLDAEQWIDAESEDCFHMRFVLHHPLLGEVFGYEGRFEVVQCPKQ